MKARGRGPEQFPTSQTWSPPYDPWAGIPESERDTVTETLANGTVVTHYYGTAENAERWRQATRREAAEVPSDPFEAPSGPAPLSSSLSGGWWWRDEELD